MECSSLLLWPWSSQHLGPRMPHSEISNIAAKGFFMSNKTTINKKRVVLFSGVAAIAIWGGSFAFQEFSNASAQPAPAVTETPTVPVGVQAVNADDVRVWSQFSGRLNAVDYAEI